MKLYLTSYRIPRLDTLLKLIDKNASEVKVVVVPNAKDYYAPRARSFKIRQIHEYLHSVGFTKIQTLDLRRVQSNQRLTKRLQEFDLLWVSGGNTFCLMRAMEKSGFVKSIRDVLETSNLVYAGESAGAIVTGESLRGSELADEPAFTDKTIWKGLSILPFTVIPHVGNTFFEESNQEMIRLHDQKSSILIKDDEAVIVENPPSYRTVRAKEANT